MRISMCTTAFVAIFAMGMSTADAQIPSVATRDVGTPSTRVSSGPSRVNFTAPYRPGNASDKTMIIGTVIDIRQVPVANVKVQLRDLVTGLIVEEIQTSATGEYTFNLEMSGTYIVEMVMADGSVMALSNAGSLAKYETLQTVVQLPGRWDTVAQSVTTQVPAGSFVGMSSTTSMTATTLVIAVNQNISPVNPGQDLSPKSPK